MTTAELIGGSINMDSIVTNYEEELADRVNFLRSREQPVVPSLAIITDDSTIFKSENSQRSPNSIYAGCLNQTAHDVGMATSIECVRTPSQIIGRIAYHNRSPLTDGIIVPIPLNIADPIKRKKDTHVVLSNIKADKDVDGLSHVSGVLAATAEAGYRVMQSVVPRTLVSDGTIVVRGSDGHVGSALVELLRQRGLNVLGLDVNTSMDDQRQAMRSASVLFSATGVAEGLLPDDVLDRTSRLQALINIGRGRTSSGQIMGDFSHELIELALERGLAVSAGAAGVGKVVMPIVLDRCITIAEKRSAALVHPAYC